MDDERTVLPLKEAYRFGRQHGLEREMAEIRDMEIEWDLSYTSSLRRGYVIDLLANKQLLDSFKDQYWPAGRSAWGQRKTEFWLRLKSRYRDFLAGCGETVPDTDEGEEDQAFAAETDLRDFLANNLDCVETGLRLYRQGERNGIEFPVEDGRIDILAIDKAGRFVVFEMKLARGREKALGQLLYYMGWVDKNLGNGPCRGIVVAKEITDALVLAAHRVEGVSLFRYKLSVSVERVS
ncbi:MAG: endonuclease NucS domain-containing protein [Planctomycetota bacterium]